MAPAQFVRMVYREVRGARGRLAYFTGCLGVGVAAVVAVAGLAESFRNGFQDGAKELLGADIALRTRQAFPEDLEKRIGEAIGDSADSWSVTYTRELPNIVSSPTTGSSLLAELKVVDGPYPLYGSLELEPPGMLEQTLSDSTVAVEARILDSLGIDVGDAISVGGQEFTIAAVAQSDPDRITGFLYLGPRVFLSEEAFATTTAVGFDVSVQRKALIGLDNVPMDQIAAIAKGIEDNLERGSGIRIENFVEGRPSLRRGLDRLETFLGMIALLSLLLGGVGVSQAVRTWINGRMDTIAILKCLGLRPIEVLALYAGEALILGVLGSALGVVAAVALLAALPPLFSEYMPVDLIVAFQPGAMLRGLLFGIAITAIFSLPPLLAILRVSPARVFRRDAEPLPGAIWTRLITGVVVLAGVAGLAAFQAGSPLLGSLFIGAVFGGAAALSLASWLTTRIVIPIARVSNHFVVRHGLAALTRPGAPTLPSIVSIGLGVLVLFATLTLQVHLNNQLDSELPKNVPSVFMADIRTEQVDGVRQLLADAGGTDVEFDPMQRVSITAVNGVSADEYIEASDNPGRQRRRLREQFVTFAKELPEGSTVVRGELWSRDESNEITMEKGLADQLDLGIDDTLTFGMGKQEHTFVITSLRDTTWDEGIDISFDIIGEPEFLTDDMPIRYICTAKLPPGVDQGLQDAVAKAYPNVIMIRLSDIIDRVTAQLGRIGWGIRFLSMFIIGAGLAVLAGSIGMESLRRGKEVALLKTLGMTRLGVASVFAVEYALIGLVASGIGVAAGAILGYLAITRGLELEFALAARYPVVAILATTFLCAAVGILASVPALRRPPIDTLRHE